MFMTRPLPKRYLKYYTKDQAEIMNLREKLRDELDKRAEVSQLEEEVIVTALQEIAQRNIEIKITFDYKTYRKDVRRMRAGERTVSLFLDEKENLQDINPLLRYISSDLRSRYERARETYLGSN